ncbi:MAG: ABC transporter ATP-binding protein [Methanothrix sp.]|nr:ABC transporter ATP-binding protein [Methanothrix sp.]
MREPSVQAEGIYKCYRGLLGFRSTVLRDISLEIEAGEIFGLMGPNGSGKTTLISVLSTLLYPERGSLRILGLDARSERKQIRRSINISTAKPNFPWSLTVRENLRHYGMLYGMHGPALSRAVEDQIDAFDLGEYSDMKFEDLSTGIKQRLSLAKAMLNHPRLLFLDEPTTGLDPDMARKTRLLVRRIHREEGISVVLSTHNMPEAEMLCDRVAFLRRGEILALDTPRNLKDQLCLGERVVVSYEGSVEAEGLSGLPGVLSVRTEPGRAEIVIIRTEESLDGIIKLFAGAKVLDITIREPDLEDVFIELAR